MVQLSLPALGLVLFTLTTRAVSQALNIFVSGVFPGPFSLLPGLLPNGTITTTQKDAVLCIIDSTTSLHYTAFDGTDPYTIILPTGATSVVLAATEGVSGTTAGWSSAVDATNGYTVFSWSVEGLGAADFYYSFSTGFVSAVFPGGDNGGGQVVVLDGTQECLPNF